MALISLTDTTLNFSGKALLDHVTLHIEEGERLCIVGRNGVGKSSMLSVLAGLYPPDSGEICRSPGLRLGYVQQAVPEDWQGTVFGIVARALGDEGEALAAAHALAEGRGDALDSKARATAERFTQNGDGWERYGEVLGVINSLRLSAEADFSTLSGGTRRRVALARALLASDLLLLDEPTNHLDISTIAWLEEYLLRRAKTLVFISHDRAMIRRLATRIIELDRGHIYSYACNFDTYLERRDERLATEDTQNNKFDKKLAQEEAWIRQGIKARRTRNMGRVRDLIALRAERAARRIRVGTAVLNAQEAEKSGKLVIETQKLGFVWDDGFRVFKDADILIRRGDKIGLIGNNGTGKTTLIKILLGRLDPTEGTVRRGTNLEIAYFDQLRDTLDPNASLMDSIAEGNDVVTINGEPRHVAGYLRDFLFDSEKLRMPVRTLSGGERNRLLLAKLFTKPSNVLVLDEPTNDLDMETLDLLEEMLTAYPGTVIVVSHDRAFLDELVTGTIALEGDGLVHEYVGGYTDWLRQRTAPMPNEPRTPASAQPSRHAPQQARRRLTFKEQKELELLQKELSEIPAAIEALEKEQADIEIKLADPDFFAQNRNKFETAAARLNAIGDKQSELLMRWEEVEARIKELEV